MLNRWPSMHARCRFVKRDPLNAVKMVESHEVGAELDQPGVDWGWHRPRIDQMIGPFALVVEPADKVWSGRGEPRTYQRARYFLLDLTDWDEAEKGWRIIDRGEPGRKVKTWLRELRRKWEHAAVTGLALTAQQRRERSEAADIADAEAIAAATAEPEEAIVPLPEAPKVQVSCGFGKVTFFTDPALLRDRVVLLEQALRGLLGCPAMNEDDEDTETRLAKEAAQRLLGL